MGKALLAPLGAGPGPCLPRACRRACTVSQFCCWSIPAGLRSSSFPRQRAWPGLSRPKVLLEARSEFPDLSEEGLAEPFSVKQSKTWGAAAAQRPQPHLAETLAYSLSPHVILVFSALPGRCWALSHSCSPFSEPWPPSSGLELPLPSLAPRPME